VDFFALYIIPTDDWYIVPYAEIGKRYATLHFMPGSRRQKYGQYLEAWHLLLNPPSASRNGIEIRACREHAETAKRRTDSCAGREGTSRVRTMFRRLFRGKKASRARAARPEAYCCGAK
jgi:hypothetical protein